MKDMCISEDIRSGSAEVVNGSEGSSESVDSELRYCSESSSTDGERLAVLIVKLTVLIVKD